MILRRLHSILKSCALFLALCSLNRKAVLGADSSTGCVVLVANLFNAAKVLPEFQRHVTELQHLLKEVGISTGLCIYENGSTDRTSLWISQWNITAEGSRFKRIIADKDPFSTSMERVSRLVVARNRALSLAREVLSEMENCSGRYLLFLNDIVYDPRDLFSLVVDGIEREYDMVCAKDVYRGFYDRWVTRDSNGMIPSRWAPGFFNSRNWMERKAPAVSKTEPQYRAVRACWNGAALIRESVAPQSFRASSPGSCYSSECKLFADDIFRSTDKDARIAVRADVTVAYDITHLILHKFFLSKYATVFQVLQLASEFLVDSLMRERRVHILTSDPCPKIPMLCC
ncbi:hypothetical protein CCYA_CCYA03G1042 [Cyanidiococcus yangmingshanensis]|nr:hypothetical protein CCYA_CCYA03G1042 [Cyanidiococcus yangmingshanensis]